MNKAYLDKIKKIVHEATKFADIVEAVDKSKADKTQVEALEQRVIKLENPYV